jgi:integrase
VAWLYERNGVWWIGYRQGGQQYLRSTKTRDRKRAQQELTKLEMMTQAHAAGSLTEEFFRLLTRKASAGDSLRAVVTQWLGECKDLSRVTLERYSQVIEEFCGHLNATDTIPLLRDVQRDTVAAFLRKKRSTTTAATTKVVRRILSAFFNYAVDNELIQFSPVPSSKSLKLTVGRRGRNGEAVRRPFTLDELATLYSKAPNDFWRYMLLAGFYMGQRMGDLICLVWGSVDFEAKIVRLTTLKPGHALKIPLHPRLELFLAELKSETVSLLKLPAASNLKPSTPIWPAEAKQYAETGAGEFSKQFYEDLLVPAGLVPARTHKPKKKQDGDRRKVNELSFHSLRHTFVSLLKTVGGTQSVAKELAGHSSDQISDLYTHNPPEVLAKTINLLPEVTK